MKNKPLHCAVAAAALLAAGGATAQATDTLAKIQSTGTAVVGVREASPPLSYLLGAGKYVGYHVQLCEQILAAIAPKAALRYMPVTSQNRIPLLQNGTIDIECGSTTNNAARKQQVDFALTTYVTEARLAVKTASGIQRAEQLQGRNVVTTTGTTLVQRLRKLDRMGITFNVLYAKDHAESFLMLESGRADAFAMDDNTLAGNIASAKNPRDFSIVGEPLGVEPISIMLRKDDARFKAAVDGELRRMIASGELAKAYDRWFMQPIAPTGAVINIPMAKSLKEALARPNDDPAEAYEAK